MPYLKYFQTPFKSTAAIKIKDKKIHGTPVGTAEFSFTRKQGLASITKGKERGMS
jgi:hypothetical protein